MINSQQINLSVLIASYNAEKYIEQCIDSVLCQSIEGIEIIIVDDGSSDHSLQIMEKYREKCNCLKVISKEHGGTLLARLEGMHQARGKYIAFIDVDDTFVPNTISNALDIAMEKKVDILEFGYNLLNAEKKEIFRRNMNHHKMPIEKIIKGKKKCFDLLHIYDLEVPLFKRFYSKRICEQVLNYFMSFTDYKIRFGDMLNEDEFITPLLFANAESYYYIQQKIYNYSFLSDGGTTYSSSVNPERRIRSGEEYMFAWASISKNLRDRKFINSSEYIYYNLQAIECFRVWSRQCKISFIDEAKRVLKYYSFFNVIYIYIWKHISDCVAILGQKGD